MVKRISADNTIILKNFSFLTILRGFNIGIKFLLVAYLIRVLGEISYGIYTWTDSIIQYFIVFINFGFNVYAAKYIVNIKNDLHQLNKITSSIFIIKGLMFIISGVLLVIISYINVFTPYKGFLLILLLTGIGEVFFPIWYFQGIEKLKTATYITVFSRLLLVLGTFLFVTTNQDLIIFIILLVTTNFLMGILGYFSLLKYHKFTINWVDFSFLKTITIEAFMFFLGGFLSLTFNFMTIFLIGLYYTMKFVTGFDIALKVVLVCIIPFDMLQQAVFPTITRNKNKNLLKKLILGSFFIGLFFSVILFFFSNQLLMLFGGEAMTEYGNVLKALSPIPPLVAVSFMLGTCTLVAFGYNKEFNQSLIISSILYLVIVAVLMFFDKLTFWNLIYLRVFSDLALLIIRVYYTLERKIFNF